MGQFIHKGFFPGAFISGAFISWVFIPGAHLQGALIPRGIDPTGALIPQALISMGIEQGTKKRSPGEAGYKASTFINYLVIIVC